ncbi:MAG TPA: hypothetical protein DCM14_01040 [Clostridiales bacterium UBA8153]|nr:hypothetical protein [Clostridiales bacterium UBA8153]
MKGSRETLQVVRALMALGETGEFGSKLVQCTRTLLEVPAAVLVLAYGNGYGVAASTGLDAAVTGLTALSLAALRAQLEARAGGEALWASLEGPGPVGLLGAFGSYARRFLPEDGELLSALAGLAAKLRESFLRPPDQGSRRASCREAQNSGGLEAMLDQVAAGLVLLGPSGQLVRCNQAGRDILDPGDDGALRAALSLGCPHGWIRCASLEGLYRGLLSSGPGGYVLVKEDAGGRWYDVTCTYVDTEGGGGEFLVLLHDVTHYRQVDDVKFHLLSMAAHEIRTPLTAIHGYLSLLRLGRTAAPGALAPSALRALDGIERNVDRLLKTLSDLMDVTRLDGRTRPLNCIPVDVSQLIQAALAETAILAESQGVVVESDLDELGYAPWDQQCIAQLLSNLLSNAIKFSPRGGLVRVSARATPTAIVIRLSDAGPGIPPAEHELIFQPFWRGDHARQTPGSGLGLAICRRIVAAHRGRIWAESQPGQGATFVVELPKNLSDATQN